MMELEQKSLKFDMEINMDDVEVKKIMDTDSGLERELEICRKRCIEFEERSKMAEERCLVLEFEVNKMKNEFKLLDGRSNKLAIEKLGVEDEFRFLNRRNEELEERISQIEHGSKVLSKGEGGTGGIVDLAEDKNEEEMVFQLMIENKILECEKKKAESEVEVWKGKFKELESRVFELEESLILRVGEHPLAGKVKGGPELPEMGSREMGGSMGLKDGLDFATNTTHLRTENEMVSSEENLHAATGGISNCNHPFKGIGNLQASGRSSIDTPCKQSRDVEGGKGGILSVTKLEYGGRVRKQLAFGEARNPIKMAPSTPAGARPASVAVIDISESDDEADSTMLHVPNPEIQRNKMLSASTDCALGGPLCENEISSRINLNRTLLEPSDEEDMGGFIGSSPYASTAKRKRASNIVISESESDDDDNVPICKLKRQHLQGSNSLSHLNISSVAATVSEDKIKEPVTRRRLVRLRKYEVKDGLERSSSSPTNLKKSETECYRGILTNEDVEDDKMDGSESEGDSLGGFIVGSSGGSESADASDESEDTSDGNMEYPEIISKIRRNRDQNSKWEFEGEMLAAFGKDSELCMKAVCALYRQQTAEEKNCKGTIYLNQRGFSQCDATRGTTLAEFLTDGDPNGDLVKSVKELQEHNPKGLELCRTLATHYSKQLFAIYKNKEDPFFLLS